MNKQMRLLAGLRASLQKKENFRPARILPPSQLDCVVGPPFLSPFSHSFGRAVGRRGKSINYLKESNLPVVVGTGSKKEVRCLCQGNESANIYSVKPMSADATRSLEAEDRGLEELVGSIERSRKRHLSIGLLRETSSLTGSRLRRKRRPPF